ncbi:MAG: DUF6788 family protein [Actinomycetota bacterium]
MADLAGPAAGARPRRSASRPRSPLRWTIGWHTASRLPLPRRSRRPSRPYIVWTRKVAGRTVARVLTDAQFAACGAYLDGDRQLRQLVDELHQLTHRVVEAGQPTTRKPRAGPGQEELSDDTRDLPPPQSAKSRLMRYRMLRCIRA